MTSPVTEWAWSDDREDWSNSGSCISRDEAIDAASVTLGPGTQFWTGRCVPVEALTLAKVVGRVAESHAVDEINEWLYENIGEDCGDAFSCTSAELTELNTLVTGMVRGWLEIHRLTPDVFTVVDIQAHRTVGAVDGREGEGSDDPPTDKEG
jgi:hypothetical protein